MTGSLWFFDSFEKSAGSTMVTMAPKEHMKSSCVERHSFLHVLASMLYKLQV